MGAINFDLNIWTLLLLVLNFVLALFVAISNRSKAATDELKSVKASLHNDIGIVSQQVVAQGQRLSHIESEVKNGITKDDLRAINRRMDEIIKTFGPVSGKLEEMSKSIDRLHDEFIHKK